MIHPHIGASIRSIDRTLCSRDMASRLPTCRTLRPITQALRPFDSLWSAWIVPPFSKSDFEITLRFVQALANCRKFGVDPGYEGSLFSTTYDWNVDCVLPCTGCDVDEEQMLRITRTANGEVVFKVSGQLTAENVAEMEALIAAERKGRRIVLDCADLRSVDGEAVKFLEKWEADSIKLRNCGLYIREWIRRERLERKSGKSLET